MKTWDIDDKVDAVYEMRMEQVNHAMRTGGPAAGGLTVRDFFAAHAISAAYRIVDHNEEEFWNASDEEIVRMWKEGDENLIAANAYEIADAMMRERERKPQEPCSVEEAFGL